MSQQTVVCIAGMHRSGTSLIARLLNLCGVDLGPESGLMRASPDNPEGYWENLWFFQSNERILTHLRGAWDTLPYFPSGWVDDPALQVIRNEAHQQLPRFTAPVWGWKDPRNSLTYPFWASLIPGMKVVICLRNPLEVANSLSKRGATSITFGLQLWWQYNMALLQLLPSQYIITHYDAYFIDPIAELRRVTRALGMQIADETLTHATSAIGQNLRHSRCDLKELQDRCFVDTIVQTYCRMLTASGPVARQLNEDWTVVEQLAELCDPQRWQQSSSMTWNAAYDELRKQAAVAQERLRLQAEAAERAMRDRAESAERHGAALQRALEQQNQSIVELQQSLRSSTEQRERLEFELSQARIRESGICHERDEALIQLRKHNQAIVELQLALEELRRLRDGLEQHLDCILSSRTWKLLYSAGIVKMAPRRR